MVKPVLRTKSIGTKVIEDDEYARLVALAGSSGREELWTGKF